MTYKLAKDYFLHSSERYSALFLLLCTILGVVGLVALSSAFAGWTIGFWASITEMSLPLYMQSIKTFFVLTTSYIGLSVLKDYLVGVLTIRWRNSLTQHFISKFTSHERNNYLDLERHAKELDNPAQRIQEDVNSYVKKTLTLGLDFFQSALTIAVFIGNLWVIGGSLTFALLGATITIPGYLVWVAILFAAVTTGITHLIGRALSHLTNTQQGLEADFRKDIELLSKDAESVAQEHGEVYYQKSLANKFLAICKNAYEILRVKIRLTAFTAFYQQISQIFPYVVAAPLYFAGSTSIGQFMEIGFSFVQIQFALSWISNSYEPISRYRTSIERIAALENAMQENGLPSSTRAITVHEEENAKELCVKDLNITYPSSTNYMMRKLNLTFHAGENTLIQAPSGLGKSTLLKVMADAWKYGDGDVVVANAQRMCFLPQRPSLPNDTLKAVLAYPRPADIYTNDQCETVLREVGGFDRYIGKLDTIKDWSNLLSLGEQQRISFARALLKKPDWLFLDEATSSLDMENEYRMYSLVKSQLKGTTFISIAHRPTVEQFHDRVINFEVDDEKIIHPHEKQRVVEQSNPSASNDDSVSIIHQSAT